MKHFEVNGKICPMTRDEISDDSLIENKSIKHATEEFLKENPWAYEYIPGETINSIIM